MICSIFHHLDVLINVGCVVAHRVGLHSDVAVIRRALF